MTDESPEVDPIERILADRPAGNRTPTSEPMGQRER